MTRFTFHSDPGHGWLQVTSRDLEATGLSPRDFSIYSYRKGDNFYLEEDCDAPKFIAAWERRHGKTMEMRDVSWSVDSFVRTLRPIY